MCFVFNLALIILAGCNNKTEVKVSEQHWAQVNNNRGGMIYIDTISCHNVMRNDPNSSLSNYTCLLVGFIDSAALLPATDGRDIEQGKYFQFDMQKDWVGISGTDSMQPVFFHPKVTLERHRKEGILVFEHERNQRLESLVYKDSYGNWGTQKLTPAN